MTDTMPAALPPIDELAIYWEAVRRFRLLTDPKPARERADELDRYATLAADIAIEMIKRDRDGRVLQCRVLR